MTPTPTDYGELALALECDDRPTAAKAIRALVAEVERLRGERIIAQCPRCNRWGEWTDGTDAEYWCQACGAECPIVARHSIPATSGGPLVVLELSTPKGA